VEVCIVFDQILALIVVILPTLFALGIEVVSKEIKDHRYWRIGVIAFGVGLSALTGFQMSQAHKEARVDQEAAIVDTSRRVSAAVSESVTQSVTKAVSEQYTQTINELHSEIGSLQAQLAAQSKKVDLIQGSNIVTGKEPIRVEIANPSVLRTGEPQLSIHASAMPVGPNPQYGKNARQIILTTNKVMNGGRVRITCKNKINQGSATISGAGVIMRGGGGMIDEKTYVSGIGSPNWSPDFPLVVTLYFDEDDLGPCTITPLS
jgi:hypothetical protein